jgi:hypothetical protein
MQNADNSHAVFEDDIVDGVGPKAIAPNTFENLAIVPERHLGC